jgi:amidase
VNAIIRDLDIAGAPHGPLEGARFAVKDNFDVAGIPTGAGNPDWLRTHPSPSASASSVERMLAAGARLVGRTLMDELAYGLLGRNVHYGTPPNPAAPGCVPGGSSSGSASAVAGALADFALGTDTGGSVRVPSSFCGLWGMRPSHGRIPIDGVVPLAPSFDTVGWFARDAFTLGRVGRVLLDASQPRDAGAVVVCEDFLAHADPEVVVAFEAWVGRQPIRFERTRLTSDSLRDWGGAFSTLQGGEIWETFGQWIERVHPRFAEDVAARLERCKATSAEQLSLAREVRERARAAVLAAVSDGVVLCFPTTPFPALPLDFDAARMGDLRGRISAMTCAAGLSGAPQISMPLLEVDGRPVGVSLLAAPGADEVFLGLPRLLGLTLER